LCARNERRTKATTDCTQRKRPGRSISGKLWQYASDFSQQRAIDWLPRIEAMQRTFKVWIGAVLRAKEGGLDAFDAELAR
jgi:hypothetical protein